MDTLIEKASLWVWHAGRGTHAPSRSLSRNGSSPILLATNGSSSTPQTLLATVSDHLQIPTTDSSDIIPGRSRIIAGPS
jgi:hypothetical protein